MRTTVVAWVLSALLGACGDDDIPGPWKNNPVPGGTSLGEFCKTVGTVACKRAEACGAAPFAACFEQFKLECCSGIAACARTAPDDVAAEVTARCVSAYEGLACGEVDARSSPMSCRTGGQ